MKKQIKNQTVAEFLNELSSKSPAPGGGSVAALLGALSAGLVSMVCNLTVGKKKYSGVEKEMKLILKKSEKLRKRFLDLAEEDKLSFLKVVEDRYSRTSLKRAAVVPARTARLAEEVLKLAQTVARKGNKNAITDAKIAVDLARAAKRGALLNVQVNVIG